MLELRNPHSILAALKARPKAVKSVSVNPTHGAEAWEEVIRHAQRNNIPVFAASVASTGRKNQRETERTGAGSAMVEPPSPIPLDMLWQSGCDSQEPGIWLAMDQVQDPQNLGAIFRLAGFFGVRGILLTKDRSATVNGTVCDVATGGTECVPFSVVANLAFAMEKAQGNDIWAVGTCERAPQSIHQLPKDRNWLLIVGNEASGLRRLTRERCDQLVSMPALGRVPSLNVAAATAACLAVLTSPVT